jgi:hypothetical protein
VSAAAGSGGGELEVAAAIAERFAAGWAPGDDPVAGPMWEPPGGRARLGGRPAEPMPAEQVTWLEARGWTFGAHRPEKQAEAMLDDGWEPAFVDGAWWWVDATHGGTRTRRPMSADQVAAVQAHWPDWLPSGEGGR